MFQFGRGAFLKVEMDFAKEKEKEYVNKIVSISQYPCVLELWFTVVYPAPAGTQERSTAVHEREGISMQQFLQQKKYFKTGVEQSFWTGSAKASMGGAQYDHGQEKEKSIVWLTTADCVEFVNDPNIYYWR